MAINHKTFIKGQIKLELICSKCEAKESRMKCNLNWCFKSISAFDRKIHVGFRKFLLFSQRNNFSDKLATSVKNCGIWKDREKFTAYVYVEESQ